MRIRGERLMKNKSALVRMPLRVEAEHIHDLALVPVGGGDMRRQRREPGIGFLHRQDNEEEPVYTGHGEYGMDPEHPVPLTLVRREHQAQQGVLLRGQIKADVPEIVALDLD